MHRTALIVFLVAAGGCSTSSPTGPTCDLLAGVWDVEIDLGSGLVGHQRWTVVQTGCDLSVLPDPCGPSCGCGPGIGDGGAEGWAWSGGFRLSWVCDQGACRDSSVLEATTDDGTLAGAATWFENPYGAGYCPSSSGQYDLTGSRI